MMQESTKYILIATVLLFAGAGFPFLMVIRVIPTSFWLSFLSYGCSVVGIVLGFYGISGMVIRRKQEDEWEDWRDL